MFNEFDAAVVSLAGEAQSACRCVSFSNRAATIRPTNEPPKRSLYPRSNRGKSPREERRSRTIDCYPKKMKRQWIYEGGWHTFKSLEDLGGLLFAVFDFYKGRALLNSPYRN
jgi:hypothetical protein